MISELTPIPTLPTKNMTRARRFYEETLGLTAEEEGPGGMFYRCGGSRLFIYESQYAGTNQATAVTFLTDGAKFDSQIGELRQRGVQFMTFEFEGMTWDHDVAKTESMRGVWFADPDGNIINLSTM